MNRPLSLAFSSLSLVFVASALAGTACSSATADAATTACDRYFHALDNECTRIPSEAVQSNNSARAPAACKRALTASGVATTPADLDACSAVLEKRVSCDAALETPAECEPKPGTRPDGAGCGGDAQCKSTFCKIGQTPVTTPEGTTHQRDACGTCAATVAENATCNGTSDRCVTGYQCLSGKCLKVAVSDVDGPCGNQTARCKDTLLCDNLTRKCAALKAAGASCLGSFECEGPLACVANKCGVRVAEGGACSSNECDHTLRCDETTQKCVKYEFVKAGAACTPTSICEPLGIACPSSATCPTVVADGQACDLGAAAARICNSYATCRDGKCVLDDPNTCK
jgi:hypothetical protein